MFWRLQVNSFMQLFWQRRHGRVSRWHTEDFTNQQLVGQHCWGVATILLHIFGRDCSRDLLVAALRHDGGEGATGDVPAPAKWAFGSDRLNMMEQLVRERLGADYPELQPWEQWALKVADSLEGYLTTLDERMRGNLMADVIFNRWKARLPDLIYVYNVRDYDSAGCTRLRHLYEFITTAYLQICTGQTDFLQSVQDTDLWKPNSAMELRRAFDLATGAVARPDQRTQPQPGSLLDDPAVQDDRAADNGALQEAIDDWSCT